MAQTINEKGQLVTSSGRVVDYLGTEPADAHIPEVIHAHTADPEIAGESENHPDGLRHEIVPERLVREFWTKLGKVFPAPHPHHPDWAGGMPPASPVAPVAAPVAPPVDEPPASDEPVVS